MYTAQLNAHRGARYNLSTNPFTATRFRRNSGQSAQFESNRTVSTISSVIQRARRNKFVRVAKRGHRLESPPCVTTNKRNGLQDCTRGRARSWSRLTENRVTDPKAMAHRVRYRNTGEKARLPQMPWQSSTSGSPALRKSGD